MKINCNITTLGHFQKVKVSQRQAFAQNSVFSLQEKSHILNNLSKNYLFKYPHNYNQRVFVMTHEQAGSSSIKLKDLNFSFGNAPIFKNLNLDLVSGDKVVLVGENGVGKSTLLKILSGEIASQSEGLKVNGLVGYLPQTLENHLDKKVLNFFVKYSGSEDLQKLLLRKEKEDPDLWNSKFNAYGGHRFLKDLHRLGLENFDLGKKLKDLSGGEKTKVHLASLAFLEPEILLLDEPTNHLDLKGILWLESFLKRHRGITMMTTHDRTLIDHTANRIAEISNETGDLHFFRGGYTHYLEEKERIRERLQQKVEIQKKEHKILSSKLRDVNDSSYRYKQRDRNDRDKLSYNAHGERKQKSTSRQTQQLRQKIDQIESDRIEVPKKRDDISMNIQNAHLGGDGSIQLDNISKKINGATLFANLSMYISSSQRWVIGGKNGSGKTTLLKIIAGITQPDTGHLLVPDREKIGFLDQEQESLDLSLTPIEQLTQDGKINLPESKLVATLIKYGIYKTDDLFIPMEFLSIGSRRKVQLAQILLKGCDILLLDEPTNHLDLPSLEHIEEQLISFPGPIIAVTHDRYFKDKIATNELNLEHYK